VSTNFPINQSSRCPAKKMPGRVHARTRQKDLHYVRSEQREIPRNSYPAARRDTPVNCPICGREVQRRARQQRFCSRRCRQKANYGEKVARGDFSTRTIARPTNPPKKDNKFKALQWAKTLSSHRVLAPAHVLACEVFGGRGWRHATSSGGVAVEVGHLRSRALVERSGGAS
jgi:hypothetical protein